MTDINTSFSCGSCVDLDRRLNETTDQLAAAEAKIGRLAAALDMALLYHSASPWNDEKRHKWLVATGRDDATTKALCDFIRSAIAENRSEK